MSYRDLEVWKRGMDLAEAVYDIARQLPESERFGLAQQMRRSAVSIPSCIAEGRARLSTREFARFIAMALGSLAELETQLLLTARLRLTKTEVESTLAAADQLGRMLQALRKTLDRKLDAGDGTATERPNR
ncbi:MAG: four helix bundle protein [Rhodanobacteraceae bacterium]|nr:four helix bundle protein [Rhodanobacteraceae bacterium]